MKQSGSIRLAIPPEKFVNMREKMTKLLRGYLHPNGSIVDVFTVLPANDGEATDVRWSAHGSPYHAPERMEVRSSTNDIYIYSVILLFCYLFIHLNVHSFIHQTIHSFPRFMHSFIHQSIHSDSSLFVHSV